jgi:hypothetical protein
MDATKQQPIIHPYCAIGGGKNGKIHSSDITVGEFLLYAALFQTEEPNAKYIIKRDTSSS